MHVSIWDELKTLSPNLQIIVICPSKSIYKLHFESERKSLVKGFSIRYSIVKLAD